MKIGILTFHNAENYGAVLQCYALYKTVSDFFPEHDVRVMNYSSPAIVGSYRILNFRRNEKISLLKNLRRQIFQFAYIPQRIKCKRNFRSFRKNFLNEENPRLSFCDAIVYGSDQIWNPLLTENDMTFFGKNFGGKKIAYGASDGGRLSVDFEKAEFIKKFDAVSCREKSLTQKIQIIRKDAKTVLDPVFLLDESEWKKIAIKPNQKDYVLVYQISENKNTVSEAKKLAQKTGKKVIEIVYVRSIKKWFLKSENQISAISPESFVGFFSEASFVVTRVFTERRSA